MSPNSKNSVSRGVAFAVAGVVLGEILAFAIGAVVLTVKPKLGGDYGSGLIIVLCQPGLMQLLVLPFTTHYLWKRHYRNAMQGLLVAAGVLFLLNGLCSLAMLAPSM